MTDPALDLASLVGVDSRSSFDMGPVLDGLGGLGAGVLKSSRLGDALHNALGDALKLDIGALLGQAWITVDSVKTALETTRDDHAASAAVPLMPHQIKSSHTPSVKLMVHGLPHVDLPFTLDLVLKIDSVVLGIEKGAVSHLKSGGLTALATLKFAGKTLMERASPRLELPGRVAVRTAGAA